MMQITQMVQMKKVLVIPFIFFLSFGLISCDDDSSSTVFFYDEPALIESVTDASALIKTAYGRFNVTLPSGATPVSAGDLLLATFSVDMDQSGDAPMPVNGFRFISLNHSDVIIPESPEKFTEHLSDSYSDSIRLAGLKNSYVDYFLFFEFSHFSPSGGTFDYELVCNPEVEEGDNIPTLYIRARETGQALLTESTTGKYYFAFNMAEYVNYYIKHNPDAKTVRFNLKYKIGMDKEGNDLYRSFQSNPFAWNVIR